MVKLNDSNSYASSRGVYFNPTDRGNLNCAYCYIPEKLRKDGSQMSVPRLYKAVEFGCIEI